MKLVQPAVLAVVVAALLASCAPKTAGNAAAGGAQGQAAGGGPASGPDVVIQASDLPKPKVGYWQIVEADDKGHSSTSQHCETGKPVDFSQMGKGCSQFTIKRTFLGDIVMDASCNEGGYATTMHITAHGDFNSSYTVDGEGSVSIPNRPVDTFKTHTEARYVGACPPGSADDAG